MRSSADLRVSRLTPFLLSRVSAHFSEAKRRRVELLFILSLRPFASLRVFALISDAGARVRGSLVRCRFGIEFLERLQFQVVHHEAQIGELGVRFGITVAGFQAF